VLEGIEKEKSMVTAIVGVLGTLLGAIVAGVFSHYREKGNRENAVKLKELEIKGQREQAWFDDRKDAYADLVNKTSVINTDKYLIDDLSQALARVQMVSNSQTTTDKAEKLFYAARQARKRTNEVRKQNRKMSEDLEARTLIDQSRPAHAAFVAAVRNELYDIPLDTPGQGQERIGDRERP
jgi:hypothetical protein